MVTKDAFFKVPRRTGTVDFPGLGTVHVRELSGVDKDILENHLMALRKKDVQPVTEGRALTFILGVFDPETGKPVFTLEDMPQVQELPAALLEAVTVKVGELGRRDQEKKTVGN